jgi:ABC-2 type transport system permease protein
VKALGKMIRVEARLFLREWLNPAFAIGLPTLLLVVFGSIGTMNQPDPDFGGLRFIDIWVPSLLVVTLAILGLQVLPGTLASYRESGILRRLSTTPVPPAYVLIAQLVVYLVAAALAVALLLAVGSLVFDVAPPADWGGFVLAWLLGTMATFGLGLLVASFARGSRTATAVGTLLFLLVMFFGGVYVPRQILPEFLQGVGEWLPPGVQALQDAWTGAGVDPWQMVTMAALALVFSAVAARTFRWE